MDGIDKDNSFREYIRLQVADMLSKDHPDIAQAMANDSDMMSALDAVMGQYPYSTNKQVTDAVISAYRKRGKA